MLQASLRLTIGIPTQGKRPDRLAKAVGSALGQSVPCRVLVADQSGDDTVTKALGPFLSHPAVRVVRTHDHARCLWDNWTACVEVCDTELFAWLQDDDTIAPHFAHRAQQGLDRCPNAVMWLARLGISLADGQANWWQATGPMVPMDLIHGGPTEVHPELIMAGAFFTSWALSPGVAFRVTPATVEAVRRCPKDCDLFVERVVLAELARHGGAVCDPAIVGMWSMHDGNESKRQLAEGTTDRQYRAMCRHLGPILAERPGWADALRGWGLIVGGDHIRRYLAEAEPYTGEFPEVAAAVEAIGSVLPPAPAPRVVTPETTESRKPRRAERAVRRA